MTDKAQLIGTILPWVAVVASIGVVGWVVTTWLRIKHGYPLDGAWGQAIYPKKNEEVVERLKLVSQRLASSPYLAGEAFTAADISVTYALNLGQRNCGITLGDAEQAYLARTTGRDAYKRAMERSHEGVNT